MICGNGAWQLATGDCSYQLEATVPHTGAGKLVGGTPRANFIRLISFKLSAVDLCRLSSCSSLVRGEGP